MTDKKKVGRPVLQGGKGEIRFHAGDLKAKAIKRLPPGLDLYSALRAVLQDIAQGNFDYQPPRSIPARLTLKGATKNYAKHTNNQEDQQEETRSQANQRQRSRKQTKPLDL